jgi:hypothetical protein
MFKSPSLRNVSRRQTFFHNGIFHSLKEVVEFYAERDTNPEKWYPANGDGALHKYNDLPAQYHANVNVEPPFDRHKGEPPRLSDQEIDDIVTFLGTLKRRLRHTGPPTVGPTALGPWLLRGQRDLVAFRLIGDGCLARCIKYGIGGGANVRMDALQVTENIKVE